MTEIGTSVPVTILLIRSSSIPHCVHLFKELVETRHANPDTRWIWISQPDAADTLKEAGRGRRVEIWTYDRGGFTFRDLFALFADRLKEVPIDTACVPVNNADGRGYFQIIRFLCRCNISTVEAHFPDGHFETMTTTRYVLGQVAGAAVSVLSQVILLLAVPCIVLYYFLAYVGHRILTGCRRSVKKTAGGVSA